MGNNKIDFKTKVNYEKLKFDKYSEDEVARLNKIHQLILNVAANLDGEVRQGTTNVRELTKSMEEAVEELTKVQSILKEVYADVMGEKEATKHLQQISTVYFE